MNLIDALTRLYEFVHCLALKNTFLSFLSIW